MVADDVLRDPKSPVRALLIEAGYEPDHWAASLESTVQSLWEARAELWRVDPVGQQAKRDAQITAIKTLPHPGAPT